MVVQHPVVVYTGDSREDEEYFDGHQREMLRHYGCSYTQMSGTPEASKHDANTIVVQVIIISATFYLDRGAGIYL